MASKKGNRIVIKLRSTESGHTYTTLKNRKNDPNRLELRRYDPTVRKHVAYRETKSRSQIIATKQPAGRQMSIRGLCFMQPLSR